MQTGCRQNVINSISFHFLDLDRILLIDYPEHLVFEKLLSLNASKYSLNGKFPLIMITKKL